MNDKVILMILDGWGKGQAYEGNAIELAKNKFVEGLANHYPMSYLQTSGEAVGLPDGQMGNSEVGHLNIGAGRIVYQQLEIINKAFREHQVASIPSFANAIKYAKENKKAFHLLGLVSDGGVHSSMDHLMGLCDILKDSGIDNIYIHAFTDGRDTDPKSGKKYMQTISENIQAFAANNIKLATIIGRYYAMDRDKRWERVKLAYDLLVHGKGTIYKDAIEAIEESYKKEVTDEFIQPIVLSKDGINPIATIKDGDVVLMFNFRTDRGRELTQALSQQAYPEFDMKPLDLHYLTMTIYDETYKNVEALFHNDDLVMTLGEVLQQNNKKQVRIAETEKYPHVTFFFSGGREKPFDGETRRMCQSPKVATYDLQPEMSAEDIKNAVLDVIQNDAADFIVVNFANPDMVGHTGVLPAVIKAVEKVDDCARQIVEQATTKSWNLLITADHGNSEYMINPDGSPNTAHTTNDVPIYLLANNKDIKLHDGKLADIAPTVLQLMHLEQPIEMTGVSLLDI